ncbi:MAG: hypothetical protein O3B01_17720 [Planctomycetota bacterium]|nr:hypothetical protein [Planctomycetota bacterium]
MNISKVQTLIVDLFDANKELEKIARANDCRSWSDAFNRVFPWQNQKW